MIDVGDGEGIAQEDHAERAVKSINGDAIDLIAANRLRDLAEANALVRVIVAGNGRESVDARAQINAQHSVECRIGRAERKDAVIGRCKGPPG